MDAQRGDIAAAFDDSIQYYDDWVRVALPSYGELFGAAVQALPFAQEAAFDILDLGAGTGLFSKEVSDRYPSARLELVDLAEKMLDRARVRFAGDRRFTFNLADYRRLSSSDSYDAVISSLSIHHLAHHEKRSLFRAVHCALRPGGVFVNVDQVRAPTRSLSKRYWAAWLAYVREHGADEAQIKRSVDRRREYDNDASLAEQLAWLEDAGFADVDCVHKNWFVGVFVASKNS